MNTEINFNTKKAYEDASEWVRGYVNGSESKSSTYSDIRDHYETDFVRIDCWHGPKKITIGSGDKTEFNFLEKKVNEFLGKEK